MCGAVGVPVFFFFGVPTTGVLARSWWDGLGGPVSVMRVCGVAGCLGGWVVVGEVVGWLVRWWGGWGGWVGGWCGGGWYGGVSVVGAVVVGMPPGRAVWQRPGAAARELT